MGRPRDALSSYNTFLTKFISIFYFVLFTKFISAHEKMYYLYILSE